jgi:O-antigen ligase
VLILAWTLFAFGAVYPWSSRIGAAATVLLFLALVPSLISRESIFGRSTWPVDTALAVFLAYGWFQYVPLPPGVVNALSPASDAFYRSVIIAGFDPDAWRPITLAPTGTIDALFCYTAAVLFFWIVREGVGGTGSRLIVRATTIMGALSVLLAVLEPLLFPNGKVYGFWQPVYAEANPMGPIISRNHFAAWMLLAAPLAAGYLVMHAHLIATTTRRERVLVRVLSDLRAFWITAGAALMVVGVLFSQSRAGLIGLSAASVAGLTGAWRGLGGRGRVGVTTLAVFLAVAAWLVSNPANVMRRFEKAATDQIGGRSEIWRATTSMSSQYRLTGVGLGAYEGAMPVYQPSPRRTIFNHAHSQYLQLWAETGVTGTLIALAILITGARLLSRRLSRDRSALASLRGGAAAALIGFAVQCIWETPLVTPALLWLLAAVAGIATHRTIAQETAPAPDDGAGA